MTTHELKCWPEFFQATYSGLKNFEVRNNDRNFAVGDIVRLEEWSPDRGYTGRYLIRNIRYVLTSEMIDTKEPAIFPGYVVLAL